MSSLAAVAPRLRGEGRAGADTVPLAEAHRAGAALGHDRQASRRCYAFGFEKRAFIPGMLAANTTTSASTISAVANTRSGARVYATMTPWLNQPSANTPAQKPAPR